MSVIAVGVDESAAATAAVLWAAGEAFSSNRRLRLVRVVDDEWERNVNDLHDSEQLIRHHISLLKAQVPGLETEMSVQFGNPAAVLPRLAKGCEMLVVGTHKTGFIQGRAFGSRSLRLAAETDLPLAVIPEHVDGARDGVVVGIDGSIASNAAVLFGAMRGVGVGEELMLVHAGAVVGRTISYSLGEELRDRKIVADATRLIESAAPGIKPRVRVLRSLASQALIGAASHARLLIVGSSRRHLNGAAALGPISHDILLNITTPTVVVHPNKFAAEALRRAPA